MKKYVDNNKAANTRRRHMVVVGTLPKAKAKAFLKTHVLFEVYGVNLDTTVDIGVEIHNGNHADEFYEYCRRKVAGAVA